MYPNKEQAILINKTLGSVRFVYNHFLDMKIKTYQATGKSLPYKECSKLLTELKKTTPWLKEPDKFSLQNSLRHLEDAYKRFFVQKNGFPKFKSKRAHEQSYTTNFTNNNIEIIDKHIKLPKLGTIRFRGYKNHNLAQYKIVKATISKDNLGHYYCAITCEVETSVLPPVSKKVGIDLGVKTFATLSNGTTIPNPRTLHTYEKKLKKEQRKLSAKKKGSNNFHKQRKKVAKLHKKIANIRKDFLQKVSTCIIKENQIICMEDLSVKSMMTGATSTTNMNKELSNVGLHQFVSMLTYKADWYGRTLIKVDKYYPSSQLCNICGYQNKELTLKDRTWTCPSCHSTLDRDYNASLNILQEGLRLIKTVTI